MSKTKRIHIFRAGTHVSMGGQTSSFSEALLQRTALAYSPAVHEAPLVLGHPETDSPAYGRVKGLKLEGGNLYAEAEVAPELEGMVRAGKYFRVSAAFYGPAASNNPRPGSHYLRHVGFLGAMPPAVKGLEALNFSEQSSLVFAEALPLTGMALQGVKAVSFSENPQGFHAAAQALMAERPGLSYAEAAGLVDQAHQQHRQWQELGADAERLQQHNAIQRLQTVGSLSYAEAAHQFFQAQA